ncbi:MAG: hypothetical protein RJA02_1848, partial [Armatimonadota bacterium]
VTGVAPIRNGDSVIKCAGCSVPLPVVLPIWKVPPGIVHIALIYALSAGYLERVERLVII